MHRIAEWIKIARLRMAAKTQHSSREAQVLGALVRTREEHDKTNTRELLCPTCVNSRGEKALDNESALAVGHDRERRSRVVLQSEERAKGFFDVVVVRYSTCAQGQPPTRRLVLERAEVCIPQSRFHLRAANEPTPRLCGREDAMNEHNVTGEQLGS
jgi:hypothetical protein